MVMALNSEEEPVTIAIDRQAPTPIMSIPTVKHDELHGTLFGQTLL